MDTNGEALAVSAVPRETPRDAIIHIATTADRLSYDVFFLPEAWAYAGTVVGPPSRRTGMPVLGIRPIGLRRTRR
jgi:hypothetical protein